MRPTSLFLAALLAGIASAVSAAPAGKLVLYTSQPDADAQGTVDAFKAAHPEVEVEWTRNGTSQLMNVLQAEFAAGDPRPDLLLVADTINLGLLKRDGRLMPYDDAPVEGYNPELFDAEGHWFGTKVIATGIAYNTSAPKVPTGWSDLVAPEAKNLVAMPSPLYSGAALVQLHSFIQDPALGWGFFEELQKNGITPQGGNGPAFNAVAGGQALYASIADYLAIRAKQKGSPVDFVFPAEGVSVVTEPVAILSTAKNAEAAKAFVDFLLSRDGQELVARQGYIPVHPAVAAPEGFPSVGEITVLPLDVERAIAEDEAVRQRFTELFGG